MEAPTLNIVLSRRGELLHFDRAAGGLRFGDLTTSPCNAVLPGDGGEVAPLEPEGLAAAAPSARCERRGDGRFATLHGLDGAENEPVLLADARALATLRDLASATWLRQTPPPLALHRALAWSGDFEASLGGLRIDVAASLDLLTNPADPDALFVIDPLARVERIFRYDPVVAYTACGGNMALYRCLEASLYSLSRVAMFPGRVIILSDRTRAELEFLVPGELRPRTHFGKAASGDVMTMALARYRLPDVPAARLARPLLYVDTDVIFDAPIHGLLAEVLLARRPCVFAEDDLRHPMDFYGGQLIGEDDSFTPRHERGFSTGVIGIPDPALAAGPFRALLALAAAQARRTGQRGTTAYDQRYANYLFHKLIDYDDAIVARYETCCNGRAPDPDRRLGLAHFAGGIGNAEPKLARMAAYLAALRPVVEPAG